MRFDNYQKSCRFKNIDIKKNNRTKNNMKPSTKKTVNTQPKGFGFADAMFGIKDIAMQYEDLQGQPIQNSLVNKPVLKMEPNLNKNAPKTVVVKKQQMPAKKVEHNVAKIQSVNQQNKQKFKISAGKQFQNLTLSQLIPIECSQNVYQLTLNAKLSQWQYNIFCDGIEAKMIVEKPQVSFNFDTSDVKQGGLGNCYFISSLAALAHIPKLLRQRIPKCKQYGEKDKQFEVNIFQSGKNIRMLVDNLFPKIFAKPVGNDISLMILQKAYAQAYGNFQIINIGHSCDSLRDLTGASTQYIDLKDKPTLITQLNEIFKNRYPIVIASKVNVKMPFLSPKHSFNVLDYRVSGGNLFLKLRDPRGNNCSQFPVYVQITQEESINGMFWVDYKGLYDNFEVITVCKAIYGWKYYYKTFSSKQLQNNQGCIKMKITQKSKNTFTFTCHQKHKKFFDQKFSYKMVRILLAKIQSKNDRIIPIETIGSDFKVQQVCSITAQLTEGEYIIFTKVGTSSNPPKNPTAQSHTLSIYTSSQSVPSFQQVKGNISISQFVSIYIQQHKEDFKQSISDQKVCRYFGPLYGYLCMYYENNGQKYMTEQLEYVSENIDIGERKIAIGPGEKKILLHGIGQSNNCSHKFAFKTKTMYK